MQTQNPMQLVLVVILLLCGYVYLFQLAARRTTNRAAMPLIAIVLLVIYAGIMIPFLYFISQLGSMSAMILALMILMSMMGVFMLLSGLFRNFREINKGMMLLFILYVLMVGYITIFSRAEGHSTDVLLSFDSIEEAIDRHSLEPLNHLMLNIAMFVPLGVLFPLIHPWKLNKAMYVIPLGLMLSTIIETTQLMLQKGQCDIEDIVANTLGGLVGLLLYRLFRRAAPGDRS